MNENISEAINDLEEEIKEKEEFIALLKTLNEDEILTEEKWHKICETGLRCSELMKVFLLNIFPEATDIRVCPNEVRFVLYGFKCAIPTSRCHGIQIDTSWYFKDNKHKKPEFYIPKDLKAYMDLKEAEKNNSSWLVKAKIMSKLYYKDYYRDFVLFFFYFFHWKWVKLDSESFEKRIENLNKSHEQEIERHEKLINNRKILVERLFDKLIPSLSKFSTSFWRLNDCSYTVDEIKKFEER